MRRTGGWFCHAGGSAGRKEIAEDGASGVAGTGGSAARAGAFWSRPDPLGMADRDLVSAARAGEAWAAGALYRRHRKMIARVAARFQQGHDCEDLVQDVFLAALRNLDRIEHPELFSNWLRAVVVRIAFARIRHQRLLRAQLCDVNAAPLEHLAWRGAPPDVSVDLNRIYRVLDSFPSEARVVFILRRVDHMSIAEVAAQLGRSVATVKRRLAHVERMLARHLAGARTRRVRPSAQGTPTV